MHKPCPRNIFEIPILGVLSIVRSLLRYPIGSGRVTFSNAKSYMKAVAAAFIEIKTVKFTKKGCLLAL